MGGPASAFCLIREKRIGRGTEGDILTLTYSLGAWGKAEEGFLSGILGKVCLFLLVIFGPLWDGFEKILQF